MVAHLMVALLPLITAGLRAPPRRVITTTRAAGTTRAAAATEPELDDLLPEPRVRARARKNM